MKNEHTISGLVAKRAEIAGKLEHHQAITRQLFIDLDALDQAIRMFAPDMELSEIKPKPMPPRHAAYKGEVARVVLGTLREAKRPCSTQELTMHVMAERGMNTADTLEDRASLVGQHRGAATGRAIGLAVVIGPPDSRKRLAGFLLAHTGNGAQGERPGRSRKEKVLFHIPYPVSSYRI